MSKFLLDLQRIQNNVCSYRVFIESNAVISDHFQMPKEAGGLLEKLDYIDAAISNKIASLELGIFIECFIVIPTLMSSPVGIPLFIAFNVLYYRSFVFLVSMLLGLIFSEGIKKMAQRKRPDLQAHKPLNITQHLMHVDSFSMPSGDTLQSAVFAIVCVYHLEWYLSTFLIIPWAAFGRVYWGNHWIGDTVIGGAIGMVVSTIICMNFQDLLTHHFF